MKRWTPVVLLALCLISVGVTIAFGHLDWVQGQITAFLSPPPPQSQFERVVAEPSPTPSADVKLVVAEEPIEPKEAATPPTETVANAEIAVPGTCALQPDPNPSPSTQRGPAIEPVTLYRFRRPSTDVASTQVSSYAPNEYQAIANPTNYGQRFLYDINSQPVNNAPIIVLHETVTDLYSTVQFFQAPHTSEDNQASYHTLINLNGDIVYIVPPDLRAFGAGNSVFVGENGQEAVKTHPKFPPSVNNFAYHISLETPADGRNNGNTHSGYTTAQYQSLAWLVSKTGVPNNRITTHALVDRSGERKDPRSFDAQLFAQLLNSYPRTQEIYIGCQTAYANQ